MTLHAAWATLENCLSDPIREKKCKNLVVRLSQCSPGYLRSILPETDTTAKSAETQFDIIVAFCKSQQASLQATNSNIAIVQYDYMPNYHGILINRSVLFLSTVRWEEVSNFSTLSVPHEPYIRYDQSSERGEYMINLYLSWLERAFKQSIKTQKFGRPS